MSSADQWRWTDDEGVQRLLRGEELRAALTDGRLKPSTLVWKRGMKSWIAASEVRELRAFIIDEELPDTVTKEVPNELGKKAMPTPSIPAPGIQAPGNMVDLAALRAAGVRGPVNTLMGVGKANAGKDGAARQELQIPAAPKLPKLDGGWRDGAARRDRDEDTVTNLVSDGEDDTQRSKQKKPAKKKTVPPPRKKGKTSARRGDKASRKPPPPAVRARRTAPLGGAASVKKTLKPRPPEPKPSIPPPVGSSEVLSERFDAKKHAVDSVPVQSTLASADHQQQRQLAAEANKLVTAAAGTRTPAKKGSIPPPRRQPSEPFTSAPVLEKGRALPLGSADAVTGPTGGHGARAVSASRDQSKTGPLPGMEDLRAMAEAQAKQRGEVLDPPEPAPQPAVAAQPAPNPPPPADLGGIAGIPTELPPKPPAVAGLTLKYPFIAGIGAAALLAVVLSFVVGRISAPPEKASQVLRARTGWAVVPLFTRTRSSTTPGPRPCLMLRAPSRFAPGATPRIPIELATAPGNRIAVGFAESRTTPRGVLVDPATGKSELVFKPETPEDEDRSLERIVPMVKGDEVGFGVSPEEADGLYRSVYVPAETPFVIGFDKENVLRADQPGSAAQRVWSLDEGAGRADALRIAKADASGFPLTYRQNNRGDKGFVYYAMLDPSGSIAHQAMALAAPQGEVGKPNIAAADGTVSVVFAHRQKVEGARWELRWARGAVSDPLKDASLVDIPAGGPGGDAGAPAITPLSGGRWLLMWMEGSSGAWTIRAQTYDRKYRPLGEALRVSPETGNFGQGVVGVVGEKAVVVFLLETAGNYEVWGTVLQCQ